MLVEGILVFDEGGAVGLGTTYNGLDFRGLQVAATGENGGGICTITVNQQTFVEVAGATLCYRWYCISHTTECRCRYIFILRFQDYIIDIWCRPQLVRLPVWQHIMVLVLNYRVLSPQSQQVITLPLIDPLVTSQ